MADDDKNGKGDTDAAKAAADKAAADKATADKAAADKLAADNVAAGKNPDGTAKDSGTGDKPIVPEKYELKLPETSPFAAADLEVFSSEAKALGLTNEQAQKMVDARIDVVNQTATAYLDDLKADKDLGGANLEKSTALAVAGRDAFLKDLPDAEAAEIKGWFNRTGLGNHKALVRAFVRLGKLVAEDKPLGEKDRHDGPQTDMAHRMYPDQK